jgi:putative spermidine/putrescine transport system substrate-binding protein
MRRLMPHVGALALLAVCVLAAGCSGGRVEDWRVDGLGSSLQEIQRNAREEGRLDLLLRAGYEERGRAEAFTRQTGCEVSTRNAVSSDDLVGLAGSGDYDGILTTSDATRRLIAAGDVAPVNYDLVPGRRDVFDDLKGRTYDTVEGMGYAVPQGRVANLEVLRADSMPPDTRSWAPLWSPALRGRISIYDDPMFLADAAAYLKATRPRLRITSPFELDQRQFDAVLGLVRRQKRNVGNYWNAATEDRQVAAFAAGTSIVGIASPHQLELMRGEDPPVPVGAVKPLEGTTGWVDEWLVSSHADHPNCMYLWLDYVVSPEANAKVVQLASEVPAAMTACQFTTNPTDCAVLHADDEEWWKDVYVWRTPEKNCGDSRGDVCKSYDDWRKAWTKIRG